MHVTVYQLVYNTIKERLNKETELRGQRTLDEWILAERVCVMNEVNRQRAFMRKTPVDIVRIERAERTAVGHSDYISKFAHAAADVVLETVP